MNLAIGAGKFRLDGWTNLDYSFKSRARKSGVIDINHNLMDGKLPLESDSVEKIYSEHCLEHLPNEVAVSILYECYRVLVPKGIIRISLPSADKVLYYYHHDKSYLRKRYMSRRGGNLEQSIIDLLFSPASGVLSDDKAREVLVGGDKEKIERSLLGAAEAQSVEFQRRRPGFHNSMWYFNKIHSIFSSIGFNKITEKERNESSSKVFRKGDFDTTYPEISMRVEAVK